MASEVLLELKVLMDQTIPPYPPLTHVCDVLVRFSSLVAEGGPLVREEVIGQGAYNEIVKAWTLFCDTGEMNVREFSPQAEQMRLTSLQALYAISAGHPEVMEDVTGFIMIKQAVDTRVPESTQIMGLKLMRNVCIKSEENRGLLTTFARVIQPLVRLIKKNNPTAEFVREWCSTIKALTLNDDKRVAYNRSAERKRLIYQQNTLRYLSQYLNAFKDGPTLNSIVIILTSMACCEDYCLDMHVGGVLPAIAKILSTMHSNSLLAKNTLSLLRFLNVSSIVREQVCGHNLMEHVILLAYLYRDRDDMLEIALSCIAFMTLRCPCHVAQFLKHDGVKKIMEIIKQMESRPVLKGASFILRNVAVHGGKEGRAEILAADGENILRQIERKYPDLKRNYTKPALRDLRLAVSPTMPPATISEDLISASIGKPGEYFSNQSRRSTRVEPKREESCRDDEKIPYPATSALFDYPPGSPIFSCISVCPENSHAQPEQQQVEHSIQQMSDDSIAAYHKKSTDNSTPPHVLNEGAAAQEDEKLVDNLSFKSVLKETRKESDPKRASASKSKESSFTELTKVPTAEQKRKSTSEPTRESIYEQNIADLLLVNNQTQQLLDKNDPETSITHEQN